MGDEATPLHAWSVLTLDGVVRTVWVHHPLDRHGYAQAVVWGRTLGLPFALKVGVRRSFGPQTLATLNGGTCPACKRPH